MCKIRKEIIWQKNYPNKLQDDVNNTLGLWDGQGLKAFVEQPNQHACFSGLSGKYFFTVIFVSNILQYKAYIINLRVNKGHIKPNKIIREWW